ncbi:hypothetical protein OOZ15_17115 [Galbibacter sp. EGI 63066]|uniref:hypothetical protein n=1 Tax=Galbibacter sp. EGI 63066 TaxID=2993559 RepID=UPI0022498E1D|nr:hypothetical protein [Galbibacter sp. EGI 63066]MCX2681676.1 hypothetical protein [Galbibacter sp. EGI 63066]
MDFFKNYLPQIFIGLGVLFSFIGGLIIYIRTNEYNSEIKKRTNENIVLTTKNKRLTSENQILITKNIEFTNLNGELINKNLELTSQNIELTDNLQKQSEIINSNITGGDSFCYILPIINPKYENRYRLLLKNDGEYLMSNIQVRIVDLNEYETANSIISLYGKTTNVTELSGKTGMIIGEIDLGKENYKNLNIFISARNGSFKQLIRMKKMKKKWHFATRVNKEDEILFEKISKDFPIEKNEDIWN